MKIWVDADACPGEIKEIILKAAHKRCIVTVFVSNKNLYIPESQYSSSVRVEQGADVADAYIEERVEANHLVITQDIPLASLVVKKGAVAISLHGDLFTSANVGERLSVRNFMQDLRNTGVQTSGPKPFSNQHKQKFANTFDQQIVKLLKKHGLN